MIWAMLLPDLTFWQAEEGGVLLGSRLGVASGDPIKSVSPSSSLVRSGDLKIKEVFHHLLHVMHRINRERER